MELMVREGLQPMGTPTNGKRIDLDLVEKLEIGQIQISPMGAAWLHETCIIAEEVPTISVQQQGQGHTLRLHDNDRYMNIWSKMPFSIQLLEGISRQIYISFFDTLVPFKTNKFTRGLTLPQLLLYPKF
jgi:hypothetical protein